VFLLALVLPGLYRSSQNYRFYRGSLNDMRAASRFLTEQNAAPIYTDPWGVELMSFFSNGELKELQTPPGELEPGSWIVLGGSRGHELSSQMISELLLSPFADIHLDHSRKPPDWNMLLKKSGPHHVARRTDLVVYRISSPPPE
jgi:hypothetical protein